MGVLALREYGSRHGTGAPPVARLSSCPPTGATTGAASQDKPPPTPCPPRMAVPNSSPPTTSSALAQAGILAIGSEKSSVVEVGELEHEESDDEEDEGEAASDFAINLANLHGGDAAGNELEVNPGVRVSLRDGGSGAGKEESESSRVVVSTVSTLALHLQRAKPNEWNELIQVVLQGLMLARS